MIGESGQLPVLEVRDLQVLYRLRRGVVRAVDGVDLVVKRGERVGVVGESGSGKSTLAFSIMRLLLPPAETVGGSILFEGADLVCMGESEVNRVRGVRLAMVYQDPLTYLNPILRVGDQIVESLMVHRGMTRGEARHEAIRILQRLRLPSPRALVDAYPHQLSGGQRQRVVIGIAIACRPSLLIADEPTTALDVTVQVEILQLIDELVQELGMSLLLISHDLAIVASICDTVNVMYAGQIVEVGPVDAIYSDPRHPYTQALLEVTTTLLKPRREFEVIPGAPPDLVRPPTGCRFAARCRFRMPVCDQTPPMVNLDTDRRVFCWLYTQSPTS